MRNKVAKRLRREARGITQKETSYDVKTVKRILLNADEMSRNMVIGEDGEPTQKSTVAPKWLDQKKVTLDPSCQRAVYQTLKADYKEAQ